LYFYLSEIEIQNPQTQKHFTTLTMDNLQVSSLIIGAFQSCRNSLYVESPKALPSKAIDEKAVLKFLSQLEAAYKYQISLKRSQRPKRKLPPVPKFEDSESHSEPQKRVHISAENMSQVNVLSKTSVAHAELTEESDDKCIEPEVLIISDDSEEEKSSEQEKTSGKAYIISQMNQMITEKNASFEIKQHAECDKKDMKKLKKLEKCLVELIKKLEIKDASVPIYCKEFLELVIPQLTEHFNKKPFIAIAAAILIFACYKAQYPITTKKILEASDSKESMVIKCFYSIKEIVAKRV